MKTSHLVSAALALAATTAFATPEGWTDDFDAAKEQAAKEGKLILVDFSGSDWCGWCKKLDKEVFSKPEFVEAASKEYVLVLIDSPSDESILSEKAKEQNPKLVKKYGIEGFPSVLIMDAEGTKLKQTGYAKGGPEAYLEKLAKLKAEAAEFLSFKKSLDALEKGGAERLAKIDEFLQKPDAGGREDYEDFVNELLANDKDGKFAEKYPEFAYVKPFEKKIGAFFEGLNDEFGKRIKELGRDPEKDDIKKIKKEVDAIAREMLPALKKDLADAKAAAPESVRESFERFEGIVDNIEEQVSDKKDDAKKDGKKGKKKGKKAKKAEAK